MIWSPVPDHTTALDRILQISVLLNDDMGDGLAGYGLTQSRAHLVWELHRRGPTTQRVLADATGVSARNITGLVDALVSTGFVTREPHPTDRRATLVTLTDRGTKATAALVHDHQELAHQLFAGMSGERVELLVGVLDDVLATLQRLTDMAE